MGGLIILGVAALCAALLLIAVRAGDEEDD